MSINNADDTVLVVAPKGRLDAHGANGLQEGFDANVTASTLCVVVDMESISYVSSSGLRVLLTIYKRLHAAGGELAICGLQPYCRQVLEMTGFTSAFHIFPTTAEALGFCDKIVRGKKNVEDWDCMEQAFLACGRVRFFKGDSAGGTVVVNGDVRSILRAGITLADMSEKPLVPGEFTIGVGGLGADNEECRNIMGEFLSVGSSLAWLPTDGNETPDFLARRNDAGSVMIRTAFSITFAGGFDDYLLFDAEKTEGATLNELYSSLFELYAKRGDGFNGMLGFVMRAQVPAFYGVALRRSPITEKAPHDGYGILSPSNVEQWFTVDATPRHTDVSAVICGLGMRLTGGPPTIDEEAMARCFTVGQIQWSDSSHVSIDKAMLFSRMPLDDKDVMLDRHLSKLRDDGNFLDIRGICGTSTITKALIGVVRVNAIEVARPPAATPPPRGGAQTVKAKQPPPRATATPVKRDIGRLFGKG